MKTFILRSMAVLGATMILSGAVAAQETSNRVAAKGDWSVFSESNPKECWGVSSPKDTQNTKDGKKVDVRRGDILLFVTFRGAKPGEVSFMGGYAFAPGSTVDAVTDKGAKFTLFTKDEGAWAGSPADDAKIIAALKSANDVTLSGKSGKGTQTQDKFSLKGFSAAMDEAAKRCK